MHSIDTQTLRKAAEHLLTIADAGYAEQFERELFERTDGDREYSEQKAHRTWALKLAGSDVETLVRRLSKALEAPAEQCRGVAMDLLGFAPRREIAVQLLARMAGEIRKLERRTTRQHFAGRRSACAGR